MKKLIVLIGFILILIIGCAKTISFQSSNNFGPTRITANLDSRLQLLRETWRSGVGDTATILVWEAIERAFHNDPKALIKLEYISSDLSFQSSDFLVLLGSYQTNYKISVMLVMANGNKMPIDGIGNGVTFTGWPSQEAVEKAVLDLQRKVAALMH